MNGIVNAHPEPPLANHPARDPRRLAPVVHSRPPLCSAGFFGLALSMMAPVVALILHIIWVAMLGVVFRMLPAKAREAAGTRS
jgi:hypothetical protein